MKLYRYSKIPERKYWKHLVTGIRFSSLSILNDPFEGHLKARDENGKITQRIHPQNLIASFTHVKPFTKINDVVDGKIEENIYMWSHYSDALNGICIKYSLDHKSALDKDYISKDVKYVYDYPEKIDEFIKYQSWKFESEFRISRKKSVLSKDDFLFFTNEENGLKIDCIYLGVRLLGKKNTHKSSEILKGLREIPFVKYLKAQYPDILIRVCARSSKSFRIVILKGEV
jgi:hypothetical protein